MKIKAEVLQGILSSIYRVRTLVKLATAGIKPRSLEFEYNSLSTSSTSSLLRSQEPEYPLSQAMSEMR